MHILALSGQLLVVILYLEVVPRRRGERPTIKDARVSVDDILEALASEWNVNEIAENYRIPREAVLEVIRYAKEGRGRSC